MAVYVIGGGFAGCEAAYQLATHGIKVKMLEMKPEYYSPAHSSPDLCEIVCSNSFKSNDVSSASGLLKEEMRRLGSLTVLCGDETSVPAGGALAVDREKFSALVTEKIKSQNNIEILSKQVSSVENIAAEEDCECIVVATGPLTDGGLAENISSLLGFERLGFYDAAAPVVFADSIDMNRAFRAARYGKGDEDYLNCPLNREEYETFYRELISAECAPVKGFENSLVYEGCMPIEVMAQRGSDTIRFGPMKPVGLDNPVTGEKYYAVVQLRQDNLEGTLYNIVGFQTRLKFGEQKRVFGLIPALRNAEYARYGVMHRNTYIKSPGLLDSTYMVRNRDKIRVPLFFAGQITGVEGYIESASSGLIAGMNAYAVIKGTEPVILPVSTMTGALASYVSSYPGSDFQPMGANFGIVIPDFTEEQKHIRDKKIKKQLISDNALDIIESIKTNRSDYFG